MNKRTCCKPNFSLSFKSSCYQLFHLHLPSPPYKAIPSWTRPKAEHTFSKWNIEHSGVRKVAKLCLVDSDTKEKSIQTIFL